MGNIPLQYGSQGGSVKELQDLLRGLGYGYDDLKVTGIYDDATVDKIKRYQESVGLAEDGIANDRTISLLTEGKGLTQTSEPTYTAPTYTESDTVKQAQAALNAQLSQKPGYTSQWQAQRNDIINKILNREEFSYDLNGDALYQQMADEYTRRGNLAMMDTMGQAATMTGGFGNSYAQSAGQQAFQAHLQELNEVAPELYQMALDKYTREGDALYEQYSMLGAEEDRNYGKYRDKMSDYFTNRDYLTDRYYSERDFDYGKYIDNRDFGYDSYRDAVSDYQWDTSLEYQKDRDEIADEQWQKEYDLAASKVVATNGGDDTTGDDDTPTGGISASDIKKMQAAIGVDQDGKWGPRSTAAAGGLSVEEAYEAWKNGTLKKVGQNTDLEMNWAENGGSYYTSVLNDLKGMKTSKKSNAEANAYLKELLDNNLISQSEYQTLYNKYRDNNLK